MSYCPRWILQKDIAHFLQTVYVVHLIVAWKIMRDRMQMFDLFHWRYRIICWIQVNQCILTSLAIDTNVGSRCKNALNFSSASDWFDARYKLNWFFFYNFSVIVWNSIPWIMFLPECGVKIVAAWSIHDDFVLNFSIFKLARRWTIQYHSLITMQHRQIAQRIGFDLNHFIRSSITAE